MNFHGITMKGEYKSQTVVDVSALVWSANDESRMLYDQTTKQIWIADDTEWKRPGINADIISGMEMWIYAVSAPTGWTINATPSDQLLAIKGGSTYITGGTAAGDYTMPAHQHNMNSHTHSEAGATLTAVPGANYEDGDSGAPGTGNHTHSFSVATTGPSPGVTSSGGAVTGYRPESSVGIICSKD
jgi:hypothetical protein